MSTLGSSEGALNAEMDHHLTNGDPGNIRNGYGRKTVTTGTGKIDLEIPRDRAGSFDPALIAKYQRRFPDFDDKIISMYARGMSTREIAGHVRRLRGRASGDDTRREVDGLTDGLRVARTLRDTSEDELGRLQECGQ